MSKLSKIATNLWFTNQAEEAVKFYTSVFKNASTGRISHYGEEGKEIHKMPVGSVLTIEFELEGSHFLALNAGPFFKFNESISFIVNCEDQQELDYFWDKLGEGGDEKAQICGWLKDKFGVSWQIVPSNINEMMADPAKSQKVMREIFKMKKLDIATLEAAYNN